MWRLMLIASVLGALTTHALAENNDFSVYQYNPKFDAPKYQKYKNSDGRSSNFRSDRLEELGWGAPRPGRGFLIKPQRRIGDITHEADKPGLSIFNKQF